MILNIKNMPECISITAQWMTVKFFCILKKAKNLAIIKNAWLCIPKENSVKQLYSVNDDNTWEITE